MAKFDKLTPAELARLKALNAEYERLNLFAGSDDIYWDFVDEMGASWIRATLSQDAHERLGKTNIEPPKKIAANAHHIKRWAEVGYIDLTPFSEGSFKQFILTPRGLDYLTYQSMPSRLRWLYDTWSDWRPDLRSAIVSALTSLIVTLVTAYLILAFHLYH